MTPFFPLDPSVRDRLAHPRVLFCFDFDGTLAALSADRDAPRMTPRTQALFDALCLKAPTAVISGRGRADVISKLRTATPKYIAGNHGAELTERPPFDEHGLDAVRAALKAVEGSMARLELEDKQFGFALHFRDAYRPLDVEVRTAEALASVGPAMRFIRGHGVLNVVPARAPNKGDVVQRLKADEGAATVLFVGDDVTDEDVFALPPSDALVTVRVGEVPDSKAAFFLGAQHEIDALLRALLELRT